MTATAMVEEEERKKYAQVWSDEPLYRVKCHSLRLWQERRDLFPETVRSALDIGCGVGRILPAWDAEGIEAWGVDLVPDACLDPEVAARFRHRVYAAPLWSFTPGRRWDLGVCADVMEHIPTNLVGTSLTCLSAVCRQIVFKIANFRSYGCGLCLHLTLRDRSWWEQTLLEVMGGRVTPVSYRSQREDYVIKWDAPS